MKPHVFWLGFAFVLSFILFSPRPVFAVSLTLEADKSQITVDEGYPVNLKLSINVPDGTIYYLRGVFYQGGTTNYCGYTWNGASWFNGPYTTNNGWQNLLPIEIKNSSWSGQLQAKIDPSDSGCSSSGTYSFKVERFTASGSGSWDSQNEQTLTVIIPTPTPTPNPTPTPTDSPTNTPVPTSIPTKMPTLKPTLKVLAQTISSRSAIASTTAMVLGAQTRATPPPVPKKLVQKKSFDVIPLLTIGSGMLILICCGILFYRNYRKKGEREND